MIVTCEHNQGRMGLCSACSAEAERSVRESSERQERRRKLEEAITTAEIYGVPEAARLLREVMRR
jgi:hypothetical protein